MDEFEMRMRDAVNLGFCSEPRLLSLPILHVDSSLARQDNEVIHPLQIMCFPWLQCVSDYRDRPRKQTADQGLSVKTEDTRWELFMLMGAIFPRFHTKPGYKTL